MPFEEGRLPVKYLGIPLVPSRLVYKYYKELVEKVEARINDWKSKSLSIADYERFSLVSRLECFNKALMAVHIWKLLTMKDSLWVAWIHLHKIKNCNFWDLPCDNNMSWGWRKVLQLRSSIREDMFRARLNTSSKVADVIVSAGMETRSGSSKPFIVNSVWHSIRPRDVKVPWADVVWFPNCISRHAFNLWLMIKGKLKTQDKLRSWDVSSSLATCCTLCETQPDSHEHLFFDCSFSKQVWCHMRDLAGLSHVPPSLELILDIINPMARRKTCSVISMLVFAASAYFIWQERNDRLYKNNKKSAAQIIKCIMSAIHLKLMSCRFKKSKAGLDLMKRGCHVTLSLVVQALLAVNVASFEGVITAAHNTLTCLKCGKQGHYRKECPKLKNRNRGKQARSTEAHEMVYALGGGKTDQDPDNNEDDIDA
nr:hypothetical protein [Tanacetum cinerariifolium]